MANKTLKEMVAGWKKTFDAEKAHSIAVTMEHGVGYGFGYATTTVAEEVKGIGRAIADTEVCKNIRDGYMDGKNDAYYDFVQRSVQREAKRREKEDAKAAKRAAEIRAEVNAEETRKAAQELLTAMFGF